MQWFAWVDHLQIEAPSKVPEIPCSAIQPVPLDQTRSYWPFVVICNRAKNHEGRHNEQRAGIIMASWKRQEDRL